MQKEKVGSRVFWERKSFWIQNKRKLLSVCEFKERKFEVKNQWFLENWLSKRIIKGIKIFWNFSKHLKGLSFFVERNKRDAQVGGIIVIFIDIFPHQISQNSLKNVQFSPTHIHFCKDSWKTSFCVLYLLCRLVFLFLLVRFALESLLPEVFYCG